MNQRERNELDRHITGNFGEDQYKDEPRIRTEFVNPPIPIRNYDWSATTDNYEPGDAVGYGKTEAEAIADLREQLEDQ